MASHKLTDNEIRIRIVPTHLRWPEAATSAVWRRLHECVPGLHELARTFDSDCVEVEQKQELGGDEIKRQRTEVGNGALRKLANFRPFDIAEQAATKEIETLMKKEDLTPQETQARQKLMKARDELRAGIAATERVLLERCKMQERTSHQPLCY